MKPKSIFVTVGTTKFDNLIEAITSDETLELLQQHGFNTLRIQTGQTSFDHKTSKNMTIMFKNYCENFQSEIKQCDVVISHAGAGTCLEVLSLNKPLIVVINDILMDNHQTELAYQLQKDKYVYCCTCKNFKTNIGKYLSNITKLNRYPTGNPKLFTQYLATCTNLI